MGIEQPADGLNFNLRQRLRQIVKGIHGAVRPTPAPIPAARVQRAMHSAIGDVLKVGEQLRSAADTPKDLPNAGMSSAWKGYSFYLNRDDKQQALISSLAARYDRVSAAAGWIPASQAPHGEMTLPAIAAAQAKCERTGIADTKADLDHRIIKFDSHFIAADRIRRSAAFQCQPVLKPKNSTPLAALVCNATRAALDEIDGYTSSLGEAGISNVHGSAVQEAVWKPIRLRVVVDSRTAVSVDSEVVSSLEPVHARNVAWDTINDRAYLRMGLGYVDPLLGIDGKPLRKFVIHRGYGDGHARQRGYGYCGHYLSYLTGLSIEQLGTVLSTYGVSTPYLLIPDGEVQGEELDQADAFLRNLGKGKPSYLSTKWGELKQTETPAGVTPLHSAMLAFLSAQKSLLVISNTLSIDMGNNVGSYGASSTHENQTLATQRIDMSLIAGTHRQQLLKYIVEVNARAWAWAFSPYVPGGCCPADIVACVPQMEIPVKPELTAPERLQMFIDAKNAGFDVDPDQVSRECNLDRPASAPASSAPSPSPPTGDPIGDAQSDDAPSEDAAATLAAAMTEHGIERCEHGMPNKCKLCGVERDRGVVPGVNGAPHGWKLAWKATPKAPTVRTLPPFRELRALPMPQTLCIMLPLPADAAAALALPGYEPAEELHVTVAYADSVPDGAASQVAVWLSQLADQLQPLQAVVGGELGTFAGEDSEHILWAAVQCEGLDALRAAAVEALTSAGCTLSPLDFIPHVTLAYLGAKHSADVPAEVPPIAVQLGAISMSIDQGDPMTFSFAPTSTT